MAAVLASKLLWIALAGTLLEGASSVLTAVMRASGHVFWPTCISLSCLSLVLCPLAWLLDQQAGVYGLRIAYPLTYAIGLTLNAGYFHSASMKAGR